MSAPGSRPSRAIPWAWIAPLAVLPALLCCRRAPLGEAFADDFFFLRRTLLSGAVSWLDGGGSPLYWRPLARQAYFGAVGPLLLSHPAVVVALHAVVLALTVWLLYDALRVALPARLAAAIASFPVLAESARMLLAWPSHFQDLGALLFAALALRETARRRIVTALAALACSLLCKELAAATALLMPWMPTASDSPPSRRQRLAWTAAVACVVAVWAAVYAMILGHGLTSVPRAYDPGLAHTPLAVRLGWAWWNGLRASLSLAPDLGRWDVLALLGAAVLVAPGLVRVARGRAPSGARAWVLWGAAWFLVAAATLTEVYPDWSPNRALFATVGIGVVTAVLCDAWHPAALGALVVMRIGLLALAPGVPDRIATQPPATGASLDFPHLARLQLLVRDTRRALTDGFPRLPHGSRVAWINMPHAAEYAFAGNRALQVWYRDTTLAWVASSDVEAHRGAPPVTVVAFQSHRTPQVVLVETAALVAYDEAVAWMQAGRIEDAFALLDRADSLQRDRRAEVFLGGLRNARAYGLYAQGRGEESAREAARSLEQWPENAQAHALIGFAAVGRGDLVAARIEADRASTIDPDDPSLRELRRRIREAEAARVR